MKTANFQTASVASLVQDEACSQFAHLWVQRVTPLWRSTWMQRLHPQSCQHWWRRPRWRHLQILTPPADASWPKMENKNNKTPKHLISISKWLKWHLLWLKRLHPEWFRSTQWWVTEKCSVEIVWYSLKDSTSSSFLTLSNSAVSSIFSSRRVGFLLSIFSPLVHCLNKKTTVHYKIKQQSDYLENISC